MPRVPPDAGLPEWLGHRASASPDRLALIAGAEHWTFRDVDLRAARTARQLATLGVTQDTRVALALRGSAFFVVLTHALARLGAVMVPLNARLSVPELAWQLADSRASVLLYDPTQTPLAAEAAQDLPGLLCISLDTTGHDSGIPPGTRFLTATPETPAPLRHRVALAAVQGIIYTSATSGRPKGVLLTYGNHWWNAIGSVLHLGLDPKDRWLAALPLYHIGGLALVWRSVIYGIPLVLHEAFDPDAVNRDIDTAGVTLISAVSTMLQRILDVRGPRPFPSTLRCILLGGGPASPALLETCFERGVPVAPTYGLTETASQVATQAPAEVARKPGAVGRPLFPAEVRIDRDGRPAAAGEVGEIVVRGPTVMRGYADRPDETSRALRDGWLHTGDLGYLDREGDLYVVDRREDLIISGGENIYPAEVESVLRDHPAVEDSGVIGLPDNEWGQVVVAAVKVRPGFQTTEDAVKAFCAGRLARYKIPTRVWFIEDLPRSSGGKLIRRTIREWAVTPPPQARGDAVSDPPRPR